MIEIISIIVGLVGLIVMIFTYIVPRPGSKKRMQQERTKERRRQNLEHLLHIEVLVRAKRVFDSPLHEENCYYVIRSLLEFSAEIQDRLRLMDLSDIDQRLVKTVNQLRRESARTVDNLERRCPHLAQNSHYDTGRRWAREMSSMKKIVARMRHKIGPHVENLRRGIFRLFPKEQLVDYLLEMLDDNLAKVEESASRETSYGIAEVVLEELDKYASAKTWEDVLRFYRIRKSLFAEDPKQELFDEVSYRCKKHLLLVVERDGTFLGPFLDLLDEGLNVDYCSGFVPVARPSFEKTIPQLRSDAIVEVLARKGGRTLEKFLSERARQSGHKGSLLFLMAAVSKLDGLVPPDGCLHLLESEDGDIVVHALLLMAKRGMRGCTETVKRLCEDDRTSVRGTAVRTISDCGSFVARAQTYPLIFGEDIDWINNEIRAMALKHKDAICVPYIENENARRDSEYVRMLVIPTPLPDSRRMTDEQIVKFNSTLEKLIEQL
jgi:hypothetical protein